jgi:hypothetical protein
VALWLVLAFYVVVWFVPLLTCVAKGKYWVALWCVVGLFAIISVLVLVPLVVPICCAIRLAKPSSFWAKRFYDDAKLERARARFAPDVPVEETRDDELVAAWTGADADPRTLDRITRKALKKEGLI